MLTTAVNERQRAYQLWLSTPESYRPDHLSTHEDLARALNVPLSQLYTWESSPGFWEVVFHHARAVIGRDLPDILNALSIRASTGNVQAIKLALEVLGVHSQHIQHDVAIHHEPLVVVATTAAEYRRLAAADTQPNQLPGPDHHPDHPDHPEQETIDAEVIDAEVNEWPPVGEDPVHANVRNSTDVSPVQPGSLDPTWAPTSMPTPPDADASPTEGPSLIVADLLTSRYRSHSSHQNEPDAHNSHQDEPDALEDN